MSQEKAAEIIDLNASREAGKAQSRIEKAGEFLANARNAAGLDLAAVGKATKVKIEHLEAIEGTRPDKLPALPYAVGFVKVYARYLDLDADAVAAQFKEDIGAAVAAPVEFTPKPVTPTPSPASGEGAKMASIFGIIAVLIFAGWVAFAILGSKRPVDDAVAAPLQSEASVSEAPAVNRVEPTPAIKTPAAAPLTSVEPSASENLTATDALETTNNNAADAAPLAPGETTPGAVLDIAPAISEPTAAAIIEDESVVEAAPAPSAPAQRRPRAPRQSKPTVVAAELTRSTAPDYPERCVAGAGALEAVTLLFDVTTGGRTANARVVSSTNACFERSALRTIKRWRFSPKTVDGAAQVHAGQTATLHFRK